MVKCAWNAQKILALFHTNGSMYVNNNVLCVVLEACTYARLLCLQIFLMLHDHVTFIYKGPKIFIQDSYCAYLNKLFSRDTFYTQIAQFKPSCSTLKIYISQSNYIIQELLDCE